MRLEFSQEKIYTCPVLLCQRSPVLRQHSCSTGKLKIMILTSLDFQ